MTDPKTRIQPIVPVKSLRTAKSRLSAVLSDRERSALVLAMLRSVLRSLQRVEDLEPPLVVTCDAEVERVARASGADVLREPACSGLNAAICFARRRLEAAGFGTLFYLPADVPQVTSGELKELLETHSQTRPAVTLVPSSDGAGTNALLVSPPGAMAFHFGPRSFSAHRQEARARGLACRVVRLNGIAQDVDRPEDLDTLPSAQGLRVLEAAR